MQTSGILIRGLRIEALQKTGSSNEENDKKRGKTIVLTVKRNAIAAIEKATMKSIFLTHSQNNSLHNSNQCRTLQQDAEKHKEEHKKNGAKSHHIGKQEIHAIVEFARQAMESAKHTGDET